jgi:hypothetical protein
VAFPVTADKKPGDDKKPWAPGTSVNNKLSTLLAYRKVRGLYIHCTKKWALGHKCAPQLHLHVLQEFWDLCNEDLLEEPDSPPEESVPAPDQQCYLVSAAVVSPSENPRTLQFRGTIQSKEIVILVDSGSTHSFLSAAVAQHLTGVQSMASPVSVKVVDGGTLTCNTELSAVEWSVQGYSFHSNLKILPLGLYDLILGMDWLGAFSPMKINW